MKQNVIYKDKKRVLPIVTGTIDDSCVNIVCPVCSHDNTHVLGVDMRVKESAVVVTLLCEDGHKFELRIQHHKGVNYLECQYLEELGDDERIRCLLEVTSR
jgi:hypothetical protein